MGKSGTPTTKNSDRKRQMVTITLSKKAVKKLEILSGLMSVTKSALIEGLLFEFPVTVDAIAGLLPVNEEEDELVARMMSRSRRRKVDPQ